MTLEGGVDKLGEIRPLRGGFALTSFRMTGNPRSITKNAAAQRTCLAMTLEGGVGKLGEISPLRGGFALTSFTRLKERKLRGVLFEQDDR